jgi:hypothetical protein
MDRYIIAKPAPHLIRGWQAEHGELDLPVGKLPPALDDFLVTALQCTSNRIRAPVIWGSKLHPNRLSAED